MKSLFDLPTPHGDKLRALRQSPKLPPSDLSLVEQTVSHYERWREDLEYVRGTERKIVSQMVSLLNEYKRFIELKLIFDSQENFLYRQKGQLKLDNTIIEEFLPLLVTTALSDLLHGYDLSFGPTTCFSGIRFESGIKSPVSGGGMKLRAKNHDFAISRPLFIRSSYEADFRDSVTEMTNIAYVAAECKTNLDKTMFQEAAATALDVKNSVPGANYYLLCEWLDMTPISTSTTAIDEIIILRKAKRLSSSIRSHFNTVSGRRKNRSFFADFLAAHPFTTEIFNRFLDHIRDLVKDSSEQDVLSTGFF